MKKSKKILSLVLVILMVFSVWSVAFSATAVAVNDTSRSSRLDEIVLEPIARPEVKFYCTDITRISAGPGSMEPGNQIVKATPSGVPETSGAYVAQAYAGETPSATRITFVTPTTGISILGLTCSNSTVVLSNMSYEAPGTYHVDIVSGTANAGEAITFTVDYTWIDGKMYQDKCVTYVENIETGGAYARMAATWKPLSGTSSWYRGASSASVRLLGKGVYYNQPEGFTTYEQTRSGNEGYDITQTFGSYNVATGIYNPNVATGFNTSLYRREWTNQSTTDPRRVMLHELFIPWTADAHVYIDVSQAQTLSDINLRLDSNAAEEYTRNNDTPAIAMTDSWVYSGYIKEAPAASSDAYVNDATVAETLGYSVPEKASYGMPGQNGNVTSVTGGVRAYQHLITTPFTGATANIADGDSYTIINKYYSYFRGSYAYITNAAMIATPITFHIRDKGDLREAIDYVLNSEPTSPAIRNSQKGQNPQSWYYKSGFQAFQTSYEEALRVLNNPKALQSEIDAAAKGLRTAYSGLVLDSADYTKVNELSEKAKFVIAHSDCYDPQDVALVEEALGMVKKGYNILYQGAVDTMALNLEEALAINAYPADYSAVDAKIEEFSTYDKALYTDESWQAVEAEIAKVDRTLDKTQQSTVDGYVTSIDNAIKALDFLLADFTILKEYLDEAKLIDKDIYINGIALNSPIAAAESALLDNETNPWLLARQSEVDTLAQNLRKVIDSLIEKSANKTALKAAIDAEIPGQEQYYNQTVLEEYKAIIAEGEEVYGDTNLTIRNQDEIDELTNKITVKYAELMETYTLPANKEALQIAVEKPIPDDIENYDQNLLLEYSVLIGEGRALLNNHELTSKNQEEIDAKTAEITAKYEELLASYKSPVGAADKENLGYAVYEAEIEIDSGDYIENAKLDELRAAVEAGKVILADDTLTADDQEKINEAERKIMSALNEIILKGADLSQIEVAENELELAMGVMIDVVVYEDGVLKTVKGNCFDTEWIRLIQEEIDEFMLEEYDIRQQETVDDFADKITEKVNNLVEQVYANSLDKAILEYEQTNLSLYTDLTAEDYTQEYNIACGVNRYDQHSINIALTNLVNAKNALELKNEAVFEAKEGAITVVDKDNGIIYGLEEGISDLENFVTYEGGVLEYVYTDNGFGTGTVVNFVVNGEVKESYTILIYGDLTGDGVVDGFDYSVLAAMSNGDLEATYVQNMAADLNGDTVADTFDLAYLGAVTIGEATINQIPEI